MYIHISTKLGTSKNEAIQKLVSKLLPPDVVSLKGKDYGDRHGDHDSPCGGHLHPRMRLPLKRKTVHGKGPVEVRICGTWEFL